MIAEPGRVSTRLYQDDQGAFPMKRVLFSVLGAVAAFASVTSAAAGDRYADRPPVMVSPDLSAPWVLQLGKAPGIVRKPRATSSYGPESAVIAGLYAQHQHP